MKVDLHPAAERELEEAAAFYEREASARLAARFLKEFWHVIELLRAQPSLGTPQARGRRSFGLRVFPYLVVYEQRSEDTLTVLVVRHHRRHPALGRRR